MSYNGVMISEDQSDSKHIRLELGSFAFELAVHRYGGHSYVRIGKFRKWSQDGKYHPDHTLSMLESDVRDSILPALAELMGKSLV